jgi:hypothetical protein
MTFNPLLRKRRHRAPLAHGSGLGLCAPRAGGWHSEASGKLSRIGPGPLAGFSTADLSHQLPLVFCGHIHHAARTVVPIALRDRGGT